MCDRFFADFPEESYDCLRTGHQDRPENRVKPAAPNEPGTA